MLYNVVLVSATQQHESALSIYICILPLEPPSHSPPHPTPLGCHRVLVELTVLHSSFPLALCFTYGNAYISVLDSGCILKVASRLADR